MKLGSVLRPALVAVFTLVIAGSAFAGDKGKSPEIVKGGSSEASAPAAACTDASGKPVTDPAACSAGACNDSTGKPVADPTACASVSGGPRSGASWDLKSNTK